MHNINPKIDKVNIDLLLTKAACRDSIYMLTVETFRTHREKKRCQKTGKTIL